MGVGNTKCGCCREDADGERLTEASGKALTGFVTADEDVPIYNSAPAYNGNHHDSWNHYDDGGYFAPPPQDDGGYGALPEPPAAVSAASSDSPRTQDKKKKDKKAKSSKDSKGREPAGTEPEPAFHDTRFQEPVPDVQDHSAANGHYQETYYNDVPNPEMESAPEAVPPPPISNDKVYGYPGMTLQIALDTGWQDYGEEEMKQVNDHLRAGSSKFSIVTRGAMYMVDFTNINQITQTNPSTRKVRSLRLASEATLAREGKGGAAPAARMADGDKAAGENGDAAAKTEKKSPARCCVIS
jgi:hypothetical protein